MRVWNANTLELRHTLSGHDIQVSCLASSSDSRFLASGNWLGSVQMWDAQTGVCEYMLALLG